MAARARIPFVIGLTGSIGMGKTTVTRQLAHMGAKTCDADAIVHRLLGTGGGAVPQVEALFPGSAVDGAIDRKALGRQVFGNAEKRKQLEALLHPMVVAEENAFIRRESRKGARLVVMDIPLLFETGAQKRCDATIVVTAPYFLQYQRVMKRPGMTAEKFSQILASQMPDRQKQRRADLVVATGLGRAYSFRQVKAWLVQMQDQL